MSDSLSRRDWIKTVGVVGAGALVPHDGLLAETTAAAPGRASSASCAGRHRRSHVDERDLHSAARPIVHEVQLRFSRAVRRVRATIDSASSSSPKRTRTASIARSSAPRETVTRCASSATASSGRAVRRKRPAASSRHCAERVRRSNGMPSSRWSTPIKTVIDDRARRAARSGVVRRRRRSPICATVNRCRAIRSVAAT